MSLVPPNPQEPITLISASISSPAPVAKKRFSFDIPSQWRPSIMNVLKEERLTSEARNEISRDLITLLYTYEAEPCAAHCKKIAALLIAKYPFMADGRETGSNKAVIYLCYFLPYLTVFIYMYML